jgi:hypothetical protein
MEAPTIVGVALASRHFSPFGDFGTFGFDWSLEGGRPADLLRRKAMAGARRRKVHTRRITLVLVRA